MQFLNVLAGLICCLFVAAPCTLTVSKAAADKQDSVDCILAPIQLKLMVLLQVLPSEKRHVRLPMERALLHPLPRPHPLLQTLPSPSRVRVKGGKTKTARLLGSSFLIGQSIIPQLPLPDLLLKAKPAHQVFTTWPPFSYVYIHAVFTRIHSMCMYIWVKCYYIHTL